MLLINDFRCVEVGSKKFLRFVGFRCIAVSNLFFTLLLQIFVSKKSKLDIEYLKSNFIAGCLEFNLVIKSHSCASLPFQRKNISSINRPKKLKMFEYMDI